MELRHLRYFVAVAEECHFGRAADRLHIAQPPLSQQIKQLEAELGVQLLFRTTRKVELTPAGARYLKRARAILADVDAAGAEAVRIAEGEIGHLVLGFVGTATYDLLPPLARTLRTEFPDLAIDLQGEMLTPSQVEALLDHRLDISFLRPPVRNPDLRVEVLRSEPLVVVLPEAHPLAGRDAVPLDALVDDPFITYPSHQRSVVYDAVFDVCRAAGFTPTGGMEVAETSTLVSFVAAGLGVALVPASVCALQITGAVYRPLVGPPAEVELAVATRVHDESPHVARVLARTKELVASMPLDWATGLHR